MEIKSRGQSESLTQVEASHRDLATNALGALQGKLRQETRRRGRRQKFHASLRVTARLGNTFIGAAQRKLRRGLGGGAQWAKAKASR